MNQGPRNTGKKLARHFLLSRFPDSFPLCFPDSLGMIVMLCSAVLFATCKREERGFRVARPSAEAAQSKYRVSDLAPGPQGTVARVTNEYEENAYAMSQGKQWYEA